MRNTLTRAIIAFTLLMAIVLLFSCRKKGWNPVPPGFPVEALAEFSNDQYQMAQGGSNLQVDILLSQKPTKNGSVRIAVENNQAIYLQDYFTTPSIEKNLLTIPVTAGVEKVSFSITPGIGIGHNPVKQVVFSLLPGEGYKIKTGGRVKATLTISGNPD